IRELSDAAQPAMTRPPTTTATRIRPAAARCTWGTVLRACVALSASRGTAGRGPHDGDAVDDRDPVPAARVEVALEAGEPGRRVEVRVPLVRGRHVGDEHRWRGPEVGEEVVGRAR